LKPGLAGQRSRLLATPILASLAWRIYEFTEMRGLLEKPSSSAEILTNLVHPEHDPDNDGMPEWDHLLQAGPKITRSIPPGMIGRKGVKFPLAESPQLQAAV
jgi:hypothetical protein